ncbi:MAG: Dabb family protein [Candidatus Hydrogenedentes bacterium]|nr:Dabb family protein [Candidatus Hydrogenedentota bacterium]
MRKYLVGLSIVACLASGCISLNIKENEVAVSDSDPAQVLRHVVLFRFKDGVSSEQIREIENAFCALATKVDTVYDFEWGTDVSTEGKADGFTHCFVVSFQSEAGRAAYLPHPAHTEFVGLIGPHLDRVLVVDYWTGD